MACKFCPKIRKTDWIFILIAALGFYAVNKLGYAPQFNTPTSKLSRSLSRPIEKPNDMTEEEGYAPQFNTPTSKLSRSLSRPIEKPNDMTEEERKKRFIELQKECLLHKDKKACEEVF
ncbi:hypothetical protein EC508_07190 [Helicobacter pylori]|uniref:hypothetical protein n=1 Tax=Helicobacter pylori TaxID=210 RepID=UPI000FDDCD7C|nr:hypothetical protein EC508_07190 [Helicobacter pylori]